MRVRVRLFARYREAAGQERLDVDLPEGGTVEAAWSAVVGSSSRRSRRTAPSRCSPSATTTSQPEHRSQPGDELCLFPPVSGGADRTPTSYARRRARALVARTPSPRAVDDPGAGGIVIFSGVVRNQTGGRAREVPRVRGARADGRGQDAGDRGRVRARWPGVKRVAMLHRIGRLEIGESSVLIAVSAAHRRRGLRRLPLRHRHAQEHVPVWKKEHFEDGEVWVGLQGG